MGPRGMLLSITVDADKQRRAHERERAQRRVHHGALETGSVERVETRRGRVHGVQLRVVVPSKDALEIGKVREPRVSGIFCEWLLRLTHFISCVPENS